MGVYNSAVITNTGQALLAQSVAGNDLKFTTVKTSNYTYPSGTSLADLTTLTGIKQSKNITGANVYNSRVIKVSAMVDNAGVTAEYSINTIGVYATVGTAAEQLFAVITAQEADKMPAFNSRPYSYIYDLNMTMQGASNITVTVNNAGFVNINDLNNALDGVNDSITDLDETVNDRIDTLSSSVDTRISALNDAYTTLNSAMRTGYSGNITSSVTGVTPGVSTIVRVGKQINFCLFFASTSFNSTSGNEITVGNVPADFRPLANRYAMGYVAMNGTRIPTYFMIKTNGNVAFVGYANGTVQGLGVAGSYLYGD